MTYRCDAHDRHHVGADNDESGEHLPRYSALPEGLLVLVHQAGDDALQAAHGAVHAEHDEHEEEDDGPELAAREGGHGLGVDLEDEAGALVRHVLNTLVLGLGHVAEVGEDHEPGEEAGEGVDGRGDETVPVAVVVELVVARIGEMHPESSPNTERERDIKRGI